MLPKMRFMHSGLSRIWYGAQTPWIRRKAYRHPLEFDYRNHDQWETLSVSFMGVAGPFRYRAPSPLRLYTTSIDEKGDKTRRLAMSVDIPSGISEGILFFFPPKDEALFAYLVAVSSTRFGPGELLVANFPQTGRSPVFSRNGLSYPREAVNSSPSPLTDHFWISRSPFRKTKRGDLSPTDAFRPCPAVGQWA